MNILRSLLVAALLAAAVVPAAAAAAQPAKAAPKQTAGAAKPAPAQQKPAAPAPAPSPATPSTPPSLAAAAPGPHARLCTPAQACLTSDECLALYLLNEERKDHHLPPLKLDRTLVDVARQHSRDMADRCYFSHFEPNTNRDPVDRYTDLLGCRPTEVVGENLGMADEPLMGLLHDCLMKSPAHRDNILDHEYVRCGIGVYEAPDGHTWLTQMFAGPEPPPHPVATAKSRQD